MVRHIVLFAFHSHVTEAEIDRLTELFDQLPRLIPGITVYERGLNSSPENHHQGYTHCFQLTFPSPAERDAYLVHPDHQAFSSAAGKYIKSVLVFDYSLS